MIGRSLAHYEIVALLGKGGMGEVYRARDTRLDRDVALKILPDEVASDPVRRARFGREAKALAALSHPNAVTIFDYGIDGDVPYAVMELLEGRTLADEMRAGPMEFDRVVAVALAVSRGLGAAHARGILHRDLKPLNVFLTHDGQVKLLDFGLAKQVGGEADALGATTEMGTAAGVVVGTVDYLPPERITGTSEGKGSDVFALGVLLHEMATTCHPFRRATGPETMAAILHDVAPAVRGVPEEFARLVRDCLQKDPALRPASAEMVERRLHALASTASDPDEDVIDSIAVLPVHNEADDEDADYLIDGLTDSLIDTLSQIPHLRVMARSTVFRCAHLHDRPEEVGRELSVRAVLAGRLQLRRGQLILRSELVDARDGALLWGGRIRRPVGDLLEIEDEICREIARNLRITLSPQVEKRLARRSDRDPGAHEAYLKGRSVWNRWKTPEAMRTAIGFFEHALELDPLYALAYGGLADSYSILGNLKALPPDEAYPKAKTAALQGLAIDDEHAELHTSLGFVQRFWDWDWEASRASFRRAIDLNPGYASAHRFHGHLLSGLGEHDGAIESVERALSLDPLAPILHTAVGDSYFYARRYDEAIERYRRCIEIDPGFIAGHTDLARALELAGHYDEAVAEFRTAEALAPAGPPEPSSGLAHVYAQMGRRAEAMAIVGQLIESAERRYVSPYGIASIHACLGEVDTALDWLDRAYAQHDQTLVWVKVHPRLDPLRGEARYQQLLERMRLV